MATSLETDELISLVPFHFGRFAIPSWIGIQASKSLLPRRDKTYKWKPLLTFWTFRTGKHWRVKNVYKVYSNTLLFFKSFADSRGEPHGANFATKPRQPLFSGRSFFS